jgi:hypothetical protein
MAPAGEIWSVVIESPNRARIRALVISARRTWLCGHVLEEGGFTDIGGILVPLVEVAAPALQRVPPGIAGEYIEL